MDSMNGWALAFALLVVLVLVAVYFVYKYDLPELPTTPVVPGTPGASCAANEECINKTCGIAVDPKTKELHTVCCKTTTSYQLGNLRYCGGLADGDLCPAGVDGACGTASVCAPIPTEEAAGICKAIPKCGKDGDCGAGGKCARLEARVSAPTYCCPTKSEYMHNFRWYCKHRPKGNTCWTGDACLSGRCSRIGGEPAGSPPGVCL